VLELRTAGGALVGGVPGADTIDGGKDNDVILARDGQRDVISCGTGKDDRAVADRIDSVATDCETISTG
jgi:hypothetical protein